MLGRPFFDRIVGKVIDFEGVLSTDRRDPGNWSGGAVGRGEFKGTKYGISAASFPELAIESLTKEQAAKIYYEHYWLPSGADDLPKPLAFLHFDSAVQHGVGGANRLLREAGPRPLRYLAHRIDYYTDIGTWDVHGGGWMNRMVKVMQRMARLTAEIDDLQREQDLDPYKLVYEDRRGSNAALTLDSDQHVVMRMAPDRKRIYLSVKESPDA